MTHSNHIRDRLTRVLVLVVTAGLVAAGCSNSDDDGDQGAGSASGVVTVEAPGVTADEIRFSAFGTNSNNPLGTCVLDCFTQGIEAYFAYRNSEGGIHGRDLVLSTKLDDEVANNKQKALEITSANDTFGAFSATLLATGWGDIAETDMPLYVWNLDPAASGGHEEIFGYPAIVCAECTKRFDAYTVQMKDATSVGIVGYGVSEISKKAAQGSRDTVERYSDDLDGAQVAYFNDNLEFGLPNGVGPEVTAMQNAGVDLIIGSLDLNGMKTLAQELERQGMGDLPMVHRNTYDQAFVKDAGDLFEGDIVYAIFRPFEADGAGSALDTFKQWMNETGSPVTEVAMYGWMNADIAYRGLKAAGPQFDRAKVIDATNKIEDFTAGGLMSPVDWGRQHDAPTEDDPATHGSDPDCMSYVVVQDGEFEIVGDMAKPWYCWPGDTRDWSEPALMNFEDDEE